MKSPASVYQSNNIKQVRNWDCNVVHTLNHERLSYDILLAGEYETHNVDFTQTELRLEKCEKVKI